MHFPTRFLVFVPFFFQEITSEPSTTPVTDNFDLTKTLKDVTYGIVHNDECMLRPWQIVKRIKEPVFSYTYNVTNNNTRKLFGSTILFDNVAFNNSGNFFITPDHVYADFVHNKMHIHYSKIEFEIGGDICIEPNKTLVGFNGSIVFQNFSVTLTKLSVGDKKFQIDISYNSSTTGENGNHLLNSDNIPYETQLNLLHVIESSMPSIILDRFHNNANLSTYLEDNFFQEPKQKIISACPDFLNNEHQYYYFIAEIPLIVMKLSNVKIRGLSNYIFFSHFARADAQDIEFLFPGTLYVKDIRVSMELDHGFKAPVVELNLTADQLLISNDKRLDRLRVEARNYSIGYVPGSKPLNISISSWLDEYSEILVEYLEVAIGRSLTPPYYKITAHRSASSFEKREMEHGLFQIVRNITTIYWQFWS